MSTKARVLAIEAQLFMSDIVPLLEERGFAVTTLAVREVNVARFRARVNELAPKFVLSVNFSPELAFLCSAERVPYVSWTVDPLPAARWEIMPGTEVGLCLAFLHRRALVDIVASLGVRAQHLPLAASPRRTPPPDEAPPNLPVTFVGNSLRGEEQGLFRRLQELRSPERTNEAAPRLERWLADRDRECGDDVHDVGVSVADLPDWLAAALHDDTARADIADRINGALSHRLRVRRLQALGPEARVWGDVGWAGIGLDYQGVADHGEALTTIYRSSTVSLDIPRIYQRDIVTMRVFDAIASGSIVVCEPSPELAVLFDAGRHLLTYRSTQEMIDLVHDCAIDASWRKHLRDAGRAHVMAHHRLSHRVSALLQGVEGWLATVHIGSS